jgi:hypothetical protein
MAQALLAIAADPASARLQARAGREYVRRDWNKQKAFGDLQRVLQEVVTAAVDAD